MTKALDPSDTSAIGVASSEASELMSSSTAQLNVVATKDVPSRSSGALSGRWASYLVKAAVLVGLLFVTSRVLPTAPPIVVALALAALSVVGAVGFAYGWVIRKTYRQLKYGNDGQLGRLNEGRTICLVVSFILAAASMVGLALESPKWGIAEWLVIVAAVPLYGLVFALAEKRAKVEFAPLFQRAEAMRWTPFLVTALLGALYLIVLLGSPMASYNGAYEAFMSVARPFDQSPAPLLTELEYLGSLKDGFIAYGMSTVASAAAPAYYVCEIVLYGFIFFGVANLLSACMLNGDEVRKVFAPLENGRRATAGALLRKRYVAVAIAVPLLFVGAFLVTDDAVRKAVTPDGLTPVRSFVRDQVNLAVFVLDGEYYDQQRVKDLLAQAAADSEELREEARETLVPLINASFDARVANVDSYLDWYYSLPADYERLATMVTGTAEDFLAEQLQSRIEEGIDDSELSDQFAAFTEKAAALEESIREELEQYKLEDVPRWLVKEEGALDDDAIAEVTEPSRELLSASGRLGAAGASGAAAGIIVQRVVKKAVAKPFFSKIASRVATALGGRALATAAGGAIGSLGGPAGIAAGIAAGTAIGVGVDALLLGIDEEQNREGYREELVSAIEEERAEMLSAFE